MVARNSDAKCGAAWGLSKKDHQAVHDATEEILETNDRLSTEELAQAFIDRSRPQNSPTHHLFEWDIRKAADIYLLDRAKKLIATVRVVFEEQPDLPTQAFPVVSFKGKQGPVQASRVFESSDLVAQLIERAKVDALNWARRYERLAKLAELRGIFRAVERATAPTNKTRNGKSKGKPNKGKRRPEELS